MCIYTYIYIYIYVNSLFHYVLGKKKRYDHANYGGYLVQPKHCDLNDPSSAPDFNYDDPFDENNFEHELESQWNLASFLPDQAFDAFEAAVGAYIQACFSQFRKLRNPSQLESPHGNDCAELAVEKTSKEPIDFDDEENIMDFDLDDEQQHNAMDMEEKKEEERKKVGRE
ncbi:hypothetical protein RFI_33996 [Reticulomyxa filosa]|uniref:Uncharacterized protein n=1 Tax=Reticulomyxa filosa TaxID=46433 RepID=X6LP91_RETFI|nr:hypothetical protein RFI_33996 [Reticulomyxa filosa]|eukprot:ETO03414.1 hypothetical protein RFI_33996 [Reticulomyxa filosa]